MSNVETILQTVQNAATNPAARQALVSDPRKVLSQAGWTLTGDTKVSVHVNDATTFHAVLPVEAPGVLEHTRAANPLAAVVYEKAWRDPAYKKQLMANPREAFIAATGVVPPPTLKLVGHENSDSEVHLVVPYVPASSELSDADLEHVAGGKGEAAVTQSCNDAKAWSGAATLAAVASVPMGTGPVGGVAAGLGLLAMAGAMIGSAVK
jgi:hypothetical protein